MMGANTENSGDSPDVDFGFRDVDAREKPGLVRDLFDRVSDRYDLMNDLMSGGIHRLWKRQMIQWLNPVPGTTLLDVAGGSLLPGLANQPSPVRNLTPCSGPALEEMPNTDR